MTTKKARKVALINVADYPRDRYTAYWTIGVDGSDEDGYRWWAEIHSYKPIGWKYEGKVTAERPDVPRPVYPPDVPALPADDEGKIVATPEQIAKATEANEARRHRIADIHAAHPQPVHIHLEHRGVTDTRDEADTAAQKWVLANMPKFKRHARPAKKQTGHALVLGPVGMLFDLLADAVIRWFLEPLLALAYSTTLRNERLNRIQVNIDLGAGAGLFRIYDGSRPATCGTATTLLAELTFTDPCAAAASGGVLTFSAITADASANATGTATWFRNVDSTGTCVVDGNVGTSGSDLNLNSTSIATGQNVAVTSYVITEGNP